MTKNELKTNLMTVRNTLNAVTVSGRDNLDHLLASIMTLERLIPQVDAMEPEEEIHIDLDGEKK